MLQSSQTKGLYAALNQGMTVAIGEWIGWLNDDEQYLPGALARVAQMAAAHPAADIFFGGAVVIDEAGRALAWRRPTRLRFAYVAATQLYALSCAFFFRRRLWERLGGFDPGLQIVGDEDFIGRALRVGARTCLMPALLGAYTVHPQQISARVADARRELALLKRRWPRWTQTFASVFKIGRRLEDAAHGWWPDRQLELNYALYQGDDTQCRVSFKARCNGRWPGPIWN